MSLQTAMRSALRLFPGSVPRSSVVAPPWTAARRTLATPPCRPNVRRAESSRPPLAPPSRSIFIQTQSTPNPDALKFLPGSPVMPASGPASYEVLDANAAAPSSLARKLFGIEGVKSLYFGPDFISVNKVEDAAWPTMKPEIYSTLMEWFSAGKPVFDAGGAAAGEAAAAGGAEDTRILDTDSEVVAMIKELLETRVRPTIQEDGGDLEFQGFDEEAGVVKLMLKGSCRGCDSSTVTLKSGIERMLMHYIPEVKEVEQVLSPEERVSNDEFAKFEARLRADGKTVGI